MAVDNFGRPSDSPITLGKLIGGLDSSVKSVVRTQSPGTDASLEKLYTATNNVAKRLDGMAGRELRESNRYLSYILTALKSGPGAKTESGGDAEGHAKRSATAMEAIYRASQSQNTFWVGLGKFSPRAQNQLIHAIATAISGPGAGKAALAGAARAKMAGRAAAKAARGAPTAGGGTAAAAAAAKATPGGGATPPGAGGTGLPGAPGLPAGGSPGVLKGALTLGLNVANVIAGHMRQAFDLDFYKHVFQGALTDSNNLRENIRGIVFEQQGFGRLNREIEKQYKNVGSVVADTGMRWADFHKLRTKNLERGLALETQTDKIMAHQYKMEGKTSTLEIGSLRRRLNEVTSITKTAGSASTMLGMQAEAINEMFMDWHMHVGLTAMDLGEVSRHMQMVSRTTGITGAQMEAAAKSSDRIVKSLKAAGGASVMAMKNVIELTAVAQKYGVGEDVSKIMQALSSKKGFFEADPQLRTALIRIGAAGGGHGLVASMVSGGAMGSPDFIKKIQKGYDVVARDVLKGFVPSLRAAGVIGEGQGAEAVDLKDISGAIETMRKKGETPGNERFKFEAGRLQDVFSGALGMMPGTFEQTQKTLEEAGKTTAQKIESAEQRIRELKPKLGESDEMKRQQALLGQLRTKEALDNMAETQRQLKKTGGVVSEDMRTKLAAGTATLQKTLGERAKAVGLDVNTLLKKQGLTWNQLQAGILEGNEDMFNIAQQLDQTIGVKERKAEDPITDIRHMLNEWNEILHKLIDPIFAIADTVLEWLPEGSAMYAYWGGLLLAPLSTLAAAFTGIKFAKWALGLMGILKTGGAAGGVPGVGGGGMGLAGMARFGIGTAGLALTGYEAYKGYEKGGVGGAIHQALVGRTADENTSWESAYGTLARFTMLGSYFGPFGAAVGAITAGLVTGVELFKELWTEGNKLIDAKKQQAKLVEDSKKTFDKTTQVTQKNINKEVSAGDTTALQKRIAEWEKELATSQATLQNSQKRLAATGYTWNPFSDNFLGSESSGIEANIESQTSRIANLKKQLEAAKSGLTTAQAAKTAPAPMTTAQEGSRQITQGGVALLHENEIVMPADMWNAIQALSAGTFTTPIGSVTPTMLGAFEKGAAGEAMQRTMDASGLEKGVAGEVMQRTLESSVSISNESLRKLADMLRPVATGDQSGMLGTAVENINQRYKTLATTVNGGIGKGLFDPDKPGQAMETAETFFNRLIEKDVSRSATQAIDRKFGDTIQASELRTVVAEAARSMYYDRSASEIADRQRATETTYNTGDVRTADYRFDDVRGDVRPTTMDYRTNIADMRGDVRTMLQGPGGVATMLERQRYEERAGVKDFVDMTKVEDKLDHLGMIYNILQTFLAMSRQSGAVRGRTINPGRGTDIPDVPSGLKSIAQGYVRGFWDLSADEISMAEVVGDGRGGTD